MSVQSTLRSRSAGNKCVRSWRPRGKEVEVRIAAIARRDRRRRTESLIGRRRGKSVRLGNSGTPWAWQLTMRKVRLLMKKR